MANDIGKLNVLLSASANGLNAGFNAAGKHLSSFAGKIKSFATSWGGIVTALGSGAALAGVIALTKASLNSIDALKDSAESLGVTTKALSELRYAASFAGVQAEAFDASMGKMLLTLDDASKGTGTAAKAFDTLGLNAEELKSLAPDQAFGKIADAISKIENPAEKAGLAVDIFGKSGRKMIPILNQGSEGLAKFAENARKTGESVSDVDAAKVEMANDSLQTLGGLLTGVGNTIAINVAPFITDLATRLFGVATEGEGMSAKVTKGLEYIAKGIAYSSDFLQLFKAGFYGFRAGALQAIAGVIGGLASLAKAGEEVLNFFGADVDFTSSLDALQKGLEQEAGEEAAKFDEALKAFNEGKNQQAVTSYFDKVRKESDEASKKVAEDNARMAKSMKQVEQAAKVNDEAAKKSKKLDEEAAKIKESVMTPLEKAQEELDKLISLYEMGKLSAETFARAQEKLLAEFETPEVEMKVAVQPQSVGLAAAGSAAAAQLQNEIEARINGRGDKDIPKKQLDETKKQTTVLERIARNNESATSLGLATISV